MDKPEKDIVERLEAYAPSNIPDWVHLNQEGVRAGDVRDAVAEICFLRALLNEWLLYRAKATPEALEEQTEEVLRGKA